jgi:hypothetical protein
MVNNIFGVVKSMPKDKPIKISKETKANWIKTLMATGDLRATDILDFINSIEPADENIQTP